jgi:hypothetical protein
MASTLIDILVSLVFFPFSCRSWLVCPTAVLDLVAMWFVVVIGIVCSPLFGFVVSRSVNSKD